MRDTLARCSLVALSLMVALVLGLTSAPAALADGGAPNLVYVAGAGTGAGDLAIIDIASKKVTGHITVGGKPHNVVLSFDGRFAYVTQADNGTLAIVDAQAKQVTATVPVGKQPVGLAIDQSLSDNRLFIANAGSDSLTVLDPAAPRTLATIAVGHTPTAVAVAPGTPFSGIADPNRPEVYVSNSDSDSVTVVDETANKVLTTIAIPGGPQSIVIPQTGGVGYVGTRTGAIVAIRLLDHKVLGTLFKLGGPASAQMDYNALTGQIYVPDPSANVVQVLRPASAGSDQAAPFLPDEPVRTLPFAGGPAAIAIPSDGVYGFVAAHETGRVSMFDTSSRQTVATLEVGGAPVSTVAGPFPPLLNRQAGNIVGFVLTGAVLAVVALVAYLFIRADRRRARESAKTAEAAMKDEESTDANAGAP